MNSSDARNRRPLCVRAFWAAILAIAQPAAVLAVEPADAFLKGLQERGLNELALAYLERIESSPLIDETFRRQIPYHRSVVLIEQSRQTADPAARTRLIDEARAALERFAEANPESVQGAEAQLQLGSVELSRGQQTGAQAAQLPDEPAYAAQRQSLRRQSRASFTTARETFVRAEEIYSAELEDLPPASGDGAKAEEGSRRQEFRARVAQLRFLAAQTRFEAAQTYSPSDTEFRKLHEDAAEELAAVYDEFARTFIVGLYARLYEGRCYQALGQYPQALGSFEDVLAQPNVLPPFRKLIASAVHRKAEVLIAQQKFDAAIDAAGACLHDASPSEQKTPEWLAVRFRMGEALENKAKALQGDSAEKRKLLAEAKAAFQFVAGSPGEFQITARKQAQSPARRGSAKDQPRTFQVAYDAGKDALAAYNAAKLAEPAAQRNNPAALPELAAQMEQGKNDARRYFQAAARLVEVDTEPKLVNEVRYFLCWLYWENQDYYRAAVLGEFLARRYPDHPAASSAAKLAMASYERLYSQAAAQGGSHSDTDFEARRMAQIAEFITRRWPGTPDAEAAQSVLVSYAIRTDHISEAEKLLEGASDQSRPQLELQLGNAMWAQYLQMAQSNRGAPEKDEAALARLKAAAVTHLRNSFENARQERRISDSAATAGLHLAQAQLSDGKYEDAIRLLEDRQLGPLALLSQKHPAASRPQFAIQAYQAALRAYVMATPPQAQKAIDMMQALEHAVKQDGGNDAQLTQVYIGLGITLQKQLAELREAGRGAEGARISAAFGQFLEKIAARQGEADWPTRMWIAQTYFEMADVDRRPGTAMPARLSDAARSYVTRSRDVYRQLLDDAATHSDLAPSGNAVLAAKMQLGECYRALGQYQQALDTFSEVLREKESSLSAQRAAAYTYQQRGQVEGADWLERAIHGGYKVRSSGRNRIWGWLKISQVAARAGEKHRDAFYEARANIARCRYLAAMKRSGPQRQQDLAKAKQGIQSLAQLYPELGSQRWRSEFDTILKQIQNAAGERPAGLREFSTGQLPAAQSIPK
jgi:hypothetical protein